MKDEIKEILDKLKDNDWYEELDLTGTKWIELKQEETNQLLDYITNLQEENERFKKYAKDYFKSKLDRKNEELELVKNKLIEEHNKVYKAIEYVNNHQLVFELSSKKQIQYWFDKFYKNLLNILNGGDEE